MKCSYCEKKAKNYTYWHKEPPRPVIHSCVEHFNKMVEAAKLEGYRAQKQGLGLVSEDGNFFVVISL